LSSWTNDRRVGSDLVKEQDIESWLADSRLPVLSINIWQKRRCLPVSERSWSRHRRARSGSGWNGGLWSLGRFWRGNLDSARIDREVGKTQRRDRSDSWETREGRGERKRIKLGTGQRFPWKTRNLGYRSGNLSRGWPFRAIALAAWVAKGEPGNRKCYGDRESRRSKGVWGAWATLFAGCWLEFAAS